MNKFQLLVLVFALLHNIKLRAGEDHIFSDGFDLSEAEIFCPVATPLIESVNSFGHEFYSATDAINPPGVKRYYAVYLQQDQWFTFGVSEATENYAIHPVMSLYHSDGSQLLAQQAEQSSSQISLTYRSVADGLYCMKVEDYSTFIGSAPQGGTEFDFYVYALPIYFNDYDEYNLDTEPNESTVQAQTGLSLIEGVSTQIAGGFNSGNDIDVFQISTSSLAKTLSLTTSPVGPTGYGSTNHFEYLEVIANNGMDIIARVCPSSGTDEIMIPVQIDTDYFVKVSQPSLPLGNNPFYLLSWNERAVENQQESHEPNNNSPVSAEVGIDILAGISPLPANLVSVYFIGGELNGLSDNDWWQFEVNTGEKIVLNCHSSNKGSGVNDATFSIFDNPMALPLQSETENPLTGLRWSDEVNSTRPAVAVNSASTHFLNISASDFSSEVLGRSYSCDIFVIPNP